MSAATCGTFRMTGIPDIAALIRATKLPGLTVRLVIAPQDGIMPGSVTQWRVSKDDDRLSASYAGLTRVSIAVRKRLSKMMDHRVKPGDDDCQNLPLLDRRGGLL